MMQSFQQHQQSSCRAPLLRAPRRTSGAEGPRLLLHLLLPQRSLARPAVFRAGVTKLMVCLTPECFFSTGRFTSVNVLPGLWGSNNMNIDPRGSMLRGEDGRQQLNACRYEQHVKTLACLRAEMETSADARSQPDNEVFQVWKADRGVTVVLCPSHPAQQPTEEPKEMSPSGDDHEKRYY